LEEIRISDERILCQTLTQHLDGLLALPPTSHSPYGLSNARTLISKYFQELEFTIETFHSADGQPILVAKRERSSIWVGCIGHYDIEVAGDGWQSPPFQTTERNGRIFARGIADNLGPLLLRLEAVKRLGKGGPSLVFVLQGEEEVGSPTAHKLFPKLPLPPVAVWLEETGYFEQNGTQRLLLRRSNPGTDRAIQAVKSIACKHGRNVEYHDRHLNKAFGEHCCPFLTHLAPNLPYVAIGPNDSQSAIHRANESLSISNLEISVQQTIAFFEAYGNT
jgi:cysteinylglycine-S-conjugate dipeptidase